MPIKERIDIFISLFDQRFAIIVHNTANKQVRLGGVPHEIKNSKPLKVTLPKKGTFKEG